MAGRLCIWALGALVAGALMMGCQGLAEPGEGLIAAPTASGEAARAPSPTGAPPEAEPVEPTPTSAEGSSEGEAKILEAIARYQEAADPSEVAAALDMLREGIATYLDATVGLALPLREQPAAIDRLVATLAEGAPDSAPRVEILDAEGREAALVDTGLGPLPILSFLWDGSTHSSGVIPPDFSLTEPEGRGMVNGRAHLEEVGDINGDGRPEVVATHQVYGASAVTTRLMILRWNGEGFEPLFDRELVEWAGPAEWELTPAGDQKEVKLSYVVLGTHSHKLLPHPTATELWRWDGTQYVMVSLSQTPPQTQRQQFNLAEADFQKRDYLAAIAGYELVFEDPLLLVEEETAEVDWIALAHFRIGQCQAMLGDEEPARRELGIAAEAGPALGELARAFLNAYQSPDGAVRAWGALQNAGLYEKAYQGEAGNLGFPVDAFHLLFPGGGVAKYLDDHPEATDGSGDDLVAALGNLGLPLAGAAIADLDGDGQREAVFVTAGDFTQHAWIAYRGGDRWLLDIAQEAQSLSIGETAMVEGGPRQAVALELGEDVQPSVLYVTWDGEKPITLLDPTTGEAWSEGSLLFEGAPGY